MPGIRVPLPAIMGLDVAGEIVSVGRGVSGWQPGQRVLVDPINRVEGGLMGETIHGGLAELCRARAHQLIPIPDGVSYGDAAALPVAYGTAMRMIQHIGQVQRGEKVLILGASGGVGVCAVQLAKAAGAYVIACAGSPEKARRLTELGADETVLYTQEDFLEVVQARHGKPTIRRAADGGGSRGVDVVVNFTGGDTWVKSLRTLRKGGRLLTCGATAGFNPPEDIRFIWTFELTIRGSNGWQREDIHALFGLMQQGQLQVPVDRVYAIEDGVEALRSIEERRIVGKVLVAP
jgi:NADPH:quinone reductase-like Zn-dependent oxidoreductase